MRNAGGPDPYPLCNIYYDYNNWYTIPTGKTTANFAINTIQGVSGSSTGGSLFFEWDGYLGLWREYGLNNIYTLQPSLPYSMYNYSWYTNPDYLGGNHTISPTWYPVGTKRVSYNKPGVLPYAWEVTNGDQPLDLLLDFKKTCFNYTYQNQPQPPGGNAYSWYDKYFSVSITGGSGYRLTAFGNWLNGTGYYQTFLNAPESIDPFNPDSGQKVFHVWNTTNASGVKVFRWEDSAGTLVEEAGLYYTLDWTSQPGDATKYSLSYKGTLPDGPESPAGTPQPGLIIRAAGDMPIRTTAGVSNIGTIDPTFELPAGVSATYFDVTFSSKLAVQTYPKHNLVKLTFLEHANITYSPAYPPTSYPPIYPIEIGDLPGRYFYLNLGAGGSKYISGFSRVVNYSWTWTPSGSARQYAYTQDSDVRVITATVTSTANTNSSGVAYTVQITMKYTHFPLFANQYGYQATPTPETTYVFTGTTPRLPYTVGAKATFTLTMNTPTTPYQNIDLGTIEAEVLDI